MTECSLQIFKNRRRFVNKSPWSRKIDLHYASVVRMLNVFVYKDEGGRVPRATETNRNAVFCHDSALLYYSGPNMQTVALLIHYAHKKKLNYH